MPVPVTRSLEIASVASGVDPLAPWIGARNAPERALAATFLLSIGGLSGALHGAAVAFALVVTLVPLPFLPVACGQVKPVAVKPPDRVEVSIVKVEPPPVIEEIPPPPEQEAPAKVKTAKKAKALESALLAQEVGLLAIIGSAPSSEVFGTLSSTDDSAVLGALVGNEIGDAFGYGGLGLSGVGVAGGVEGGGAGGGSIGLGGLGTIGHGSGGGSGAGFGSGSLGHSTKREVRVDIVDTDLDRPAARRALVRRSAKLLECERDLPVDVTVRVKDGVVASIDGAPACVTRALEGLNVAGSGYAAVHLALR